jgi:hypothetical protein
MLGVMSVREEEFRGRLDRVSETYSAEVQGKREHLERGCNSQESSLFFLLKMAPILAASR